jgi:hypothetical protein
MPGDRFVVLATAREEKWGVLEVSEVHDTYSVCSVSDRINPEFWADLERRMRYDPSPPQGITIRREIPDEALFEWLRVLLKGERGWSMGIETKVAKILNSREVIINKGAMDGVETGMRFNVLEPGVTVLDPDSKSLLGHLTRSKICVEIVEVEPTFSVARTFETYRENNRDAFSSVLGLSRYVTMVKTIRQESGSHFEFREDSVDVSVGDLVVQAPQPQT